MCAVLDTNVLVSAAIFPQSVPHRALDLVREHGELIFTVSSFAEIQETLFRSNSTATSNRASGSISSPRFSEHRNRRCRSSCTRSLS
jgi:predicted nucleic acid-binding protein